MSGDVEFVKKEDKNVRKPVERTLIEQAHIPAEYIPIKLSSLGKLDAPAVVHIKDYSGEDALHLALGSTDTNTFLRELISVINNVMYEGFDAAYFHENELEEIMLNIIGNFWTPVIKNFPYPYEDEEYNTMDEERKERVREGKETLQVDIPLTVIDTHPINPDFKEPITIKNKEGFSIQFILPRIKHIFVAEEYTAQKYIQETQDFANIEKITNIDNNEERQKLLEQIPQDQIIAYKEYINRRTVDYIAAKQCQLIVKFGSKVLETFEDKLKVYTDIKMGFWGEYNSLCEKHLQFGIDHNIKMVSPITKQEVIRRCQFRPMDFVPAHELSDSGRYTVSFGEQ